jgi:hypothetical protein
MGSADARTQTESEAKQDPHDSDDAPLDPRHSRAESLPCQSRRAEGHLRWGAAPLSAGSTLLPHRGRVEVGEAVDAALDGDEARECATPARDGIQAAVGAARGGAQAAAGVVRGGASVAAGAGPPRQGPPASWAIATRATDARVAGSLRRHCARGGPCSVLPRW